MADKLIISVVVCTYNRSDILGLCLDSLSKQTLDKSTYEVIIVNNNSTDDTEEVIKNFIAENSNFRSFIELNQGSSHARNRGAKEAIGEYLAFIDDDGKAYPNWTENIIKFIEKHPEVNAFGGPYIGYSQKKIPAWLPKNFGSWSLGNEEKEIIFPKGWLTGTNMIFGKKTFLDIGGFDTSKGPKGNNFAFGEDTFLIYTFNKNHIPIWYVPDIKVQHLTDDKKFKFSWIFTSGYNAGKVDEKTFNHNHHFFYYIILFIFHLLKYGIRLLNLSKFGENMHRLFHTLSYDVGILASKIIGNNN